MSFKEVLWSSKNKFFSEKISECDDQKSLFRVTKDLLHLKGKPKLPSQTDKANLAETFNNFFADNIKNIRSELDNTTPEPVSLSCQTTQNIPVLDKFTPVTEEDVVNIIKKAPCKTCALDPVPSWMVQKHLGILAPTLTRIVNMSLEQGVFPSSMKHALVSPLLKKAYLDCEQLRNYRPVSNLAYISKVIERVVDAQLAEHISHHRLHEPMQSAYLKFHGTETALVKVQNDLLLALDRRQGAFLVMLDLSSAFDTIDHQVLLERLRNNVGVTGTAYKWVESYLTDRYQAVSVQGVASKSLKLEFGVPQGSVLGPKLFTVYSAPIAKICNEHSLPAHMYADGSQLYLWFDLPPHSTEEVTKHQIESCVSDILKWTVINKLKLNEEKTELLILSTPHQMKKVSSSSITIGESVIGAVDVVKN